MADKKKVSLMDHDYMLLLPVVFLLGVGLVFVYSASSHTAAHRMGDTYFYLKRQGLFCLLGLALMIIAKNTPSSLYARMVYPLLLASFSLLAILHIPGVGSTVGGAHRWLRVAGFSFQPSELAKFALAVYLAYSMSKKGSSMSSFSKGMLPNLLVAGVFMLMILLQPDLGTAAIIGCWVITVLFVGGANPFMLSGLILIAGIALRFLIMSADYRMARWWAFLNPWEDPQGIGFQIIHSFLAFGSGGLFGTGLGNSKQKLFYLPEAHTDFVLSIAAEEVGLVGVGLIIILFTVIVVRGVRIALNARDLYSTYLAFGLTCLIGLQVVVNMGVVMGLLPTKGLTLPLISYGGSSLAVNLLIIGVLLNISAQSRGARSAPTRGRSTGRKKKP